MDKSHFVQFVLNTCDGMDGRNPIIRMAKEQKNRELNSKFVDSIYQDIDHYPKISSIEQFENIDDKEKYKYVNHLKIYAQNKYMTYTEYTEEEKSSGIADLKEQEKEKQMIDSPEFKTYLDAVSKLNEEQFAFFAFNEFSSSVLLKMYGDEEKLFENRLNKLNIVDLITISKHYANGSHPLVVSAIENAKANSKIDNKINGLVNITEKVFEDISNFRYPIGTTGFFVPASNNFFNLEKLESLDESFEKADKIAKMDNIVINQLEKISELDDEKFVEDANKFNKQYTVNDVYKKPDDFDWDDSYNIEEKMGKAINNLTYFYKSRIISLPKNLKAKLENVKGGIISDVIQVTKNHEVLQTIKDLVDQKRNNENDIDEK